jgi:hypothetical protein
VVLPADALMVLFLCYDGSMNKKIIGVLGIVVIASVVFGIYWMHKLNVAHSSFENYYNFRGCVQLLEKTDMYGTCKLSSGQTIKLVKIQNKWYLDGDGPGVF